MAVTDLGEKLGGHRPPLFWAKKEEMTGGRKAGRASKIEPPLGQKNKPRLAGVDIGFQAKKSQTRTPKGDLL